MRRSTIETEAAFRKRLTELGATPAWDKWRGTHEKHAVVCVNGHNAFPLPNRVLCGGGPCRTCVGQDPAETERKFLARLADLSATPAYEKWCGTDKPHRVACQAGHECNPRPAGVIRGSGICAICAGNDTATAETAFRRRLAAHGATPAYEVWRGVGKPHDAICAKGHPCQPRPQGLQQGKGPCLACAGRDSVVAEAKFKARLTEIGATPLWDTWLGNDKPHHARCAAGHDCWPTWAYVQIGGGPCLICANKDPATQEAAFLRRLARLGATPAYGKWLGSMRKHRVICKQGHECWPIPSNLQQGYGACRRCAGREWDIFYVVASDDLGWVKVGITSGNPEGRLGEHRRRGYRRLIFLADISNARVIEEHVLEVLARHGHSPVRGREYFSCDGLDVILATARLYSVSGEGPMRS